MQKKHSKERQKTQERQSKKNTVNRESFFLAFGCYCEERGEKIDKMEREICC